MQLQQVSLYWDQRAEGYSHTIHHQLENEVSNFYRDLLAKCAPPGNPLHCLDVGCGPGFFSMLLAQLGHHVTAVDCSPGMLEKARENFHEMGLEVSTVQADVERLPFSAESFDYVVSRDLTWALRHPRETYLEWLRVLKPGGKLLIVDSNHYLHYHDGEYAQAQQQIVSTDRLHGVDPTCMEEFARDVLPLSRVRRPQWDVNTLLELGVEHIELQGNRQSFQDVSTQETKSVVEDFFLCATKLLNGCHNFMGTVSFYQK